MLCTSFLTLCSSVVWFAHLTCSVVSRWPRAFSRLIVAGFDSEPLLSLAKCFLWGLFVNVARKQMAVVFIFKCLKCGRHCSGETSWEPAFISEMGVWILCGLPFCVQVCVASFVLPPFCFPPRTNLSLSVPSFLLFIMLQCLSLAVWGWHLAETPCYLMQKVRSWALSFLVRFADHDSECHTLWKIWVLWCCLMFVFCFFPRAHKHDGKAFGSGFSYSVVAGYLFCLNKTFEQVCWWCSLFPDLIKECLWAGWKISHVLL